jgi:predicted dehydrogenase
MRRLREVLDSGALGEILFVSVDYAEVPPPHKARMFDPTLGGGALMDIGIYCFSLTSFALGAPDGVSAVGHLRDGVDDVLSAVLTYPSGAHAHVFTSMRLPTPTVAQISGTAGCVMFDRFWNNNYPWTHVGQNGTVVERFDDRPVNWTSLPFGARRSDAASAPGCASRLSCR